MTGSLMIKAVLKTIEQGSRFLVASHENPDGDAIGSTLGLANALLEMGKEVAAYNRDGVPETFAFLPGSATMVTELPAGAAFDAGFILDAGELRRAGRHLRDHCRTLVNIDHHPYAETFGAINWIDERASATGAMIHRLLKAGGHPISTEVARCLYTAVLSDTGSFRYANADPEAFLIAAEMVELGVDPWEVASSLYESFPEVRMRLLGRVLPTLAVSPCGSYAAVTATTAMMTETGAGPEHTDGFINYPRAVRGVEVAVFFRQISPHAFKAGFRSKGKVDVGALARSLGGGGHHNAAGAVIEGTLEQVRRTVFTRLDALFAEG